MERSTKVEKKMERKQESKENRMNVKKVWKGREENRKKVKKMGRWQD
jgi:hypothetical protein